jgi:hypothetical protein
MYNANEASLCLQTCEGIKGRQTRASEDGQGESFRGRKGRGRITDTCQCLIGSVVKWCLDLIDRITP